MFWKYIKFKVKVKHDIPSLVDSVAVTDFEKAEILNNYFSCVFTCENLDSIPAFNAIYHGKPIDDFDISPDLVYQHLRGLKPDKSLGPDRLHPRILKETASITCIPLIIIF